MRIAELLENIVPYGSMSPADYSVVAKRLPQTEAAEGTTAPHNRCRLKRHLISTSIHLHGRPAESKPAPAISTHHPNTR
jgi:hypothetical protein